MERVVVVLSGGMDSATLLYHLADAGTRSRPFPATTASGTCGNLRPRPG